MKNLNMAYFVTGNPVLRLWIESVGAKRDYSTKRAAGNVRVR